MYAKHSKRRAASSLVCGGIAVIAGCGTTDLGSSAVDAEEPIESTSSALGIAANVTGCDPIASAGTGWKNTFFPQSAESFELRFRAHPQGSDAAGRPLIDGVIGLSNGPATGFSKLGPIIRFNPSGSIDARNGNAYAGSFPYRTGNGLYEFQMSVDIPSHTYSVWVRHLDAQGKPFELLANNFAFRTEQSAVTRLDNIGRFVDSAQGALQTCGFQYLGPTACSVSGAGTWQSQSFPPRTQRFKLEFDALPAADSSGTVDAVIGAAKGAPTAFTGLAAIVRFRPDGTLDARNGATYAADAVFRYADTTTYHITMDIDPVRGRYSVAVKDPMVNPEQPATILARDYKFRSEQAATRSFDHLGQFVDGSAGTVHVCSLTIVY